MTLFAAQRWRSPTVPAEGAVAQHSPSLCSSSAVQLGNLSLSGYWAQPLADKRGHVITFNLKCIRGSFRDVQPVFKTDGLFLFLIFAVDTESKYKLTFNNNIFRKHKLKTPKRPDKQDNMNYNESRISDQQTHFGM